MATTFVPSTHAANADLLAIVSLTLPLLCFLLHRFLTRTFLSFTTAVLQRMYPQGLKIYRETHESHHSRQ